MDVSIIIVNYNTSQLLINCLNSIREITIGVEYEIIVIDNASTDGSIAMIKKQTYPVNLIESKTNLGFGKANNLGAKSANGKYLFFLNTDILLINNAIKTLFNFMEDELNKGIGACGGNLFKEDLTKNFSYATTFPSLWDIFCYRFRLPVSQEKRNGFNSTNNTKEVAFIIGADLFMPRIIFNKLKGFDPAFFMYIEDCELQFRLKKENYSIVSVPDAKIIHLQGQSSTSSKRTKMEITSYSYYFKKHYTKIHLYLYLIIEVFHASSKTLFHFLKSDKTKQKEFYSLLRFVMKKHLWK